MATKRHEATKAKVHEFEKRNHSKLVAYQSTGGWWKFGGRSALIYYHQVAKRLGLRPKLRVDTDYYSKFEEGVISIKDIDKLEEKLKTIGIVRVSGGGADVRVFDLGYKLSDEDLKRLQAQDEEMQKELNRMVQPVVMMPEVYAKLREIMRDFYFHARKDDALVREYLSKDLAKLAMEMMSNYLEMANGLAERQETLEGLMRSSERLLGGLKMLEEVKAYTATACTKMAVPIVELKKLVQKELERVEKEESKNDK